MTDTRPISSPVSLSVVKRRDLLRAVPLALLPAGCLAGSPSDGSDGSPTPETELVESDLRVGEKGCGKQVDSAQVSFDPDVPAVTVDGTIWGSDTCHTARLADATYAAGDDRLTVHVVAVRPETEEPQACGQCIVEVDYGATCTFTGALPGTVRVVHGTGDRRTVVTTTEAP